MISFFKKIVDMSIEWYCVCQATLKLNYFISAKWSVRVSLHRIYNMAVKIELPFISTVRKKTSRDKVLSYTLYSTSWNSPPWSTSDQWSTAPNPVTCFTFTCMNGHMLRARFSHSIQINVIFLIYTLQSITQLYIGVLKMCLMPYIHLVFFLTFDCVINKNIVKQYFLFNFELVY